jgi:methylated-DNA-[protein]-cysteine S-methyltransferase
MTRALDLAVLPTPVGPLAVIADDGVVVTSTFGGADDARARLSPELAARGVVERVDLGAVSRGVAAYTAGEAGALDDVPVRQPGTELLQTLWSALREVKPGTTVSYAGLAEAAGRPKAVRLAGSACARNLVAPFVPCHRVVRTDGSLGGYYYGLDIKRALLAHEGARL